jgi:hypothetical protein
MFSDFDNPMHQTKLFGVLVSVIKEKQYSKILKKNEKYIYY